MEALKSLAAKASTVIQPSSSTTQPTNKPTSIQLPETTSPSPSSTKTITTTNITPGPKTPATPANEAIEFFSSEDVGDSEVQVWEVELEDDGGPSWEKRYIRLPPPSPPYILRISLAAGSVATRNGTLVSDFPLNGGAFARGDWKRKELGRDLSKAIKVDLPISAAGAFCYFIEYDDVDDPKKRSKSREGYFNVDPIIHLPARKPLFPSINGGDEVSDVDVLEDTEGGTILPEQPSKPSPVPLDALSVLSIIAKWQGPMKGWDKHLAEASRRGYNMIHYTPLQERGQSGSPYSIYDQYKFDHELLSGGNDGGIEETKKTMLLAKEKYGLGSLTDVVLNHTANNSPWLEEHPEAGYSPANSPHLTPALELDDAMIALSGRLASLGLPTNINSESDLAAVMRAVGSTISELALWQYYVLDVKREKEGVAGASPKQWKGQEVIGSSAETLAGIAIETGIISGYKSLGGRFIAKVDPAVAAGLVQAAQPNETDLAAFWGKVCDVINVEMYRECDDDLKAAKEGIEGRLKYTRMDPHGPKMGEITEKSPLIESYFMRLPKNATTAKHPANALSLACNGWMWGADPLSNFAEYPSKAYLRRQVIVWNDCVKLRYGKGPQDNPFLWEHMIGYTKLLAGIFDGFRLDNCHSTPLHVGVTMIDAAREINPNLYVIAELFTGSEAMDLIFVSRIGINSLVREAYNASDPKDFSRLLYQYGVGKAIGSMGADCLSRHEDLVSPTGRGAIRKAKVTPHQGSSPHTIFYDCTHDNETPLDKRTAEDALSTAALVLFTSAAAGSVKGFDDLYPKLLNLVTDTRAYEVVEGKETNAGIGKAKHVLNHLHQEMMLAGFVEGHVHQEGDYILFHRVQPSTGKGYLLVAHTAFHKGGAGGDLIHPFRLSRQHVKYVFGANIKTRLSEYKESTTTHRGLPSTLTELPPAPLQTGTDVNGMYTEVVVPQDFEPGSIMVFSTQLEGVDTVEDAFYTADADEAFSSLDLVDLNALLYRADGEERDATGGDGTYDVPGYGQLVYCGLEGWMAPLRPIMRNNDLGHALCSHLRAGCWALDYIVTRLEHQLDVFPRLKGPAVWLRERFDRIKRDVAPFMRPKYFALVVYEAYKAGRRAVIEQCSEFISSGHPFTQDLALCSVQMYGMVQSASINPAKPVASLAAGLPHFAAGWARCWGRDVFISLRGLFLTTGNFSAARDHILAFGSTLKHGLIPNLLDSTRNPRYNSRDSPWWMIQNIQDYTKMCPNGHAILKDSVKRRFPADDSWVAWDDSRAYAYSSTVAELIQEIVQRHAEGIEFREYNAGPNLDMDMKDEGFNQKIWVDWKTGLIYGGNRYNCGTWMDKMGSSDRAGNKGLPATPRDGSPIEITGLLKSTLNWLHDLSSKGAFPFKGVTATIDGQKREITYKHWADLIQASFEKSYWVPEHPEEDAYFDVNPGLVNRRGIYKDVFGTPKDREWSDYQFRCNFTISMIVAPELFTPTRAMSAIRLADKVLRGPLGMKTLDPADKAYRGDYDNSNDSTDQAIAKGWNYHQGPEWVFPTGWFLMAYLMFDRIAGEGKENPEYTFHHISQILLKHREHVANDAWRGLPELTNSNGSFCFDSCRTQAWSASTILDVLEEMHRLSQNVD